MAARRNKNGQFTSSKRKRRRTTTSQRAPRRKSKPSLSLLNTAESLVVANAMTNLLFDTNIGTFVTGRNVMSGFGENGKNNSWEITAPELLSLITGGSGGVASNYQHGGTSGVAGALKRNLKTNLWSQGLVLFGAPFAFNLAKRTLRKPVINPANKILRQVGIKGVKV